MCPPSGSPSISSPKPEKTEAEVRAEVAQEKAKEREDAAKKANKRRGKQATYGPLGPAATLVSFRDNQETRKSAKL